jgi:hypothetical protein
MGGSRGEVRRGRIVAAWVQAGIEGIAAMCQSTRPPAGYRLQSDDTDWNIEQRQIEAYRRMTSVEKATRVAEQSRFLEELTRAGIRQRYPDADEPEMLCRLAALRLGRDLAIAAYGWDPRVHGY